MSPLALAIEDFEGNDEITVPIVGGPVLCESS